MTTITSPTPAGPLPANAAIKTILRAFLIAGTLDIIAAILLNGALSGSIRPLRILQGVASGIFGKDAFTGGNAMALYGLLLHYCIALLFTIAYFLVFPYLTFLRTHKVLAGLLYGILAWVIMNRIVLPLSNVPMGPFRWDRALLNMVILMLMIGLPISLIVHRYYTSFRTRDRLD